MRRAGSFPSGTPTGRRINGAGNAYYLPASDANNVFIGDPVIIVTDSDDGKGIQTVELATAGANNYAIGVVVSLLNAGDPALPVTRESPRYRRASTEQYVLVADDPDLLFEAQEDGVGGAMGAGSAGRNVNLVAGSGSTVTGYSGWELDSSTLATGNTLQMRIRGGG